MKNKNWEQLFNYIFVIIIILLLIKSRLTLNNESTNIIYSDGMGYYGQLTATFIYNDYSTSWWQAIETKYPEIKFPLYVNATNGDGARLVNKYFVGVSLMMSPFFFIAHFLAKAFGMDADGYSYIYQYAMFASAMCYLLLALLMCQRILLRLGISTVATGLALFAITFGTNLYYYVTVEPTMSHVYSFFLITMLFYWGQKLFHTFRRKHLYLLAATFGFIIITRPVNAIAIAGLLIFAQHGVALKQIIKTVSSHKYLIFNCASILLSILTIQFSFWYIQVGKYLVWTYGQNEGFNFLRPHLLDVLFSFRKGLFIYSPVLLLIFPGIIILYRKNKMQSMFTLLALLAATYVIGSWKEWYYGMSFGMRPFIDYYFLFAFLIAICFDHNIFMKVLTIIIVSVCIHINVQQTYQYRKYILHWRDMTFEKYKMVFLKTGQEWQGYLWNRAFYNDYYTKQYATAQSPKLTSLPLNAREVKIYDSQPVIDSIDNEVIIRFKFSLRHNSLPPHSEWRIITCYAGNIDTEHILSTERITCEPQQKYSTFTMAVKAKKETILNKAIHFTLTNYSESDEYFDASFDIVSMVP